MILRYILIFIVALLAFRIVRKIIWAIATEKQKPKSPPQEQAKYNIEAEEVEFEEINHPNESK